MHKSRSHFRVRHNGIETFVPVSYFTIIQSRDFETDEATTIRLALEESSMIAVAMGADCDPVLDKGKVFDEHGQPIEAGTFTVNEHSSGFSVTHNESGENHWLSDGVDALGFDEGYQTEEEVTLHPGTLGFVELWTEAMNHDGEAMQAYFPHLDDE
jgi:hypothetical protein